MPIQTILPSLTPLLNAAEENLHGHVAFVQRSISSMKVIEKDGLLIVDSGLRTDTFNKVCRARLRESEADRRIAEAIAYFRDVQRPFAWWVGPGSRPLDLESRLQDQGLRAAAEPELGMAMELGALPARVDGPSNLVVRRVRSVRELTDFSHLFAANWDPPDQSAVIFYEHAGSVLLNEDCAMKLFIGYLDGQAVSGSELFVSQGERGEKVAGLYSMATRREFRRRGIGSVLAWTGAREAQREGISTMTSQSSDEGKGVYTRLGFRACCHFTEYAIDR
jgi:ribosomal protein S18 acetylase RimI-like enzyme